MYVRGETDGVVHKQEDLHVPHVGGPEREYDNNDNQKIERVNVVTIHVSDTSSVWRSHCMSVILSYTRRRHDEQVQIDTQ